MNEPKNLTYMENKLTWVELKKAVARQTGLTEKDVNILLTTWIDEMAAALQRGEELHINGLGTFKIKEIKPRKSVNVTTGEPIILPAGRKLTYMMAANMIDELNDKTPVRTEVGVDPIQKLSEQADEIVDILADLGQIPQAEAEAEKQEPQQQDEYKPKPKPAVIPEYKIEPKVEPKEEKEEEQDKKKHLWLTALITILVFVLLVIGLFYFFQYKITNWLNDLREKAEMVDEIPEITESATVVPFQEDTVSDTIPEEEVNTTEDEQVNATVRPEEYTDFIGTEEMHQDSRLSWMAYRYYGKKDLWVFIYDANKDHIKDPNFIPVGTSIRIPKLDEDVLQLATPEIQAQVKQMADEFLKK